MFRPAFQSQTCAQGGFDDASVVGMLVQTPWGGVGLPVVDAPAVGVADEPQVHQGGRVIGPAGQDPLHRSLGQEQLTPHLHMPQNSPCSSLF